VCHCFSDRLVPSTGTVARKVPKSLASVVVVVVKNIIVLRPTCTTILGWE
jgi:hypothetical protein